MNLCAVLRKDARTIQELKLKLYQCNELNAERLQYNGQSP